MERAQEAERVFDGVAAFKTEQDGEATFGASGEDVGWSEAEAQFLRMKANLFERSIEELEGAVGVGSGGVLFGVDPECEELCGEVAGAGGGEVDHAGAEIRCEVPMLIEEALGSVGVGIDDEG